MRLVISLGQMDIHAGEPALNLEHARAWVEEAARRGSDIVVLPELWDTGYALDRAGELGQLLGAGRFAQMAGLARAHRIHIVGSMLEVQPGAERGSQPDAYNTAVWFAPDGSTAGVYRKVHLFRLMHEERYLKPGAEPALLDLPWGKTGLAICYDLRFPELFRRYVLHGAVMVVVPAQWPHPRMSHWQTLLRARAIENQMVVVGCNRVGREKEAHFGGYSVILDAWGKPVIEGGEAEELLTAEIDLAEVSRIRQWMPVLEDRRPQAYG